LEGEAIEITLQSIFIDNKIWTPEKIALALKLQASYPGHDWRKILVPDFQKLRITQHWKLTYTGQDTEGKRS